jgi:hypothetical protein
MSSSNLGNLRCGSLDSLHDSCGPEIVKVVEVVTGNRPYSEASDDGEATKTTTNADTIKVQLPS